MPSLAFYDLERMDFNPEMALCFVLMPSRAFYDLELQEHQIQHIQTTHVLMPSRAFYDLEPGGNLAAAAAGYKS